MEDKFKIFLPFDSIEKATDENGKTVMRVAGVISDSMVGPDKDGEVIDVEGMDFSSFLKSGFINYNHLAGKDPEAIIGEPTRAFIKDGKAHVEGFLYEDSPMAQKIYSLANTLSKNSSSRRLGYSIEGQCKLRDSKNPKRILKSAISGLAITPSPKNAGTELIVKGEFDYETQDGGDYLIDIIDDGVRYTVDRNLNIEKAMVAGAITGTETTNQSLTAEPLKEESIDGKKKRKKKESLTKAEVFYELISRYNMDSESCKMVYDLCCKIQSGIN